MTIAQGILKTTSGKKQTSLGVPGVYTGSQTFRRETSQFMMGKDTYENNEIVSHQQSTGITHGLRKPTGKISGVLSPNTYSTLFSALTRKLFTAGVSATGLGLTIGGSAGAWTLTRGSGSYLTDGFKIGDVVRVTAATSLNADVLNKNLLITSLTATIATCVVLNGSTMTTGVGTAATVAVTGKKSIVPLTGHTNEYWMFEDWYSDVARSELYTDMQIGKADIGLPGSGNATVSFDLVGLGRSVGATQILTSPTAETTTPVLSAVSGVVLQGGAAVANITGVTISIDGSIAPLGAVVGSNSSPDTQKGRIKVSGQVTAYFQDGVLGAIYEAGTTTSLIVVLAQDTTATAKFVGFTLSSIKLSSDSPDDGEKGIIRTFSFTGEVNSAGGAALANDQTIISIQDSDAA